MVRHPSDDKSHNPAFFHVDNGDRILCTYDIGHQQCDQGHVTKYIYRVAAYLSAPFDIVADHIAGAPEHIQDEDKDRAGGHSLELLEIIDYRRPVCRTYIIPLTAYRTIITVEYVTAVDTRVTRHGVAFESNLSALPGTETLI